MGTTTPTPQFPPGWYQNPVGPGQRYYDGEHWTDSYSKDNASEDSSPPMGLVVAGYIFAVLMPLIGFVLGIVVVTRPAREVARHGLRIIVLSIVAFLIWFAIFSAVAAHQQSVQAQQTQSQIDQASQAAQDAAAQQAAQNAANNPCGTYWQIGC